MKIIGIVGSNATFSYNRLLLQFIKKHFSDLFQLEILEIKALPLFSQNKNQEDFPIIQEMADKISQADGVLIATPEHNHTITSALKSTIEWLSYQVHPLENKPVMILGASYYQQGSSRAQVHLRQILNAPGVNAWVLPGNEFLLSDAKYAFDENNDLKDSKTINFLETCLQNFIHYVAIVQGLQTQRSTTAVDATTGASESWNTSTSTPTTIFYHAETLFDKALTQHFGNPLTHSATDPFDTYLDLAFPQSKKRTPFEVALDQTFGVDLKIEGKDVLDTII